MGGEDGRWAVGRWTDEEFGFCSLSEISDNRALQ